MKKSNSKKDTWFIDQIAKSELFYQKLHEWKMLEIAEKIEQIKGERLNWSSKELGISKNAWNKVIHRGIKPVIVFAHPQVLIDIVFFFYKLL